MAKRQGHVFSGPPTIPESRISRFRFSPWLSPRGLSKTVEVQAPARIHPNPVRFTSQLVLRIMAPPTFVVDHVRTAKCPELLCPTPVLLVSGWRPAPPRRALPLLHCSYELMRQTSSLLRNLCIHTYLRRSWQVAASPCWELILPDVISASLSQDA